MKDEGEEPLAALTLVTTAGMTAAGGAELARQGLIDKSEWGDGPWQDEPDLLQWCSGTPPHYECQIARTDWAGTWAGYVAVPTGHPAHGKARTQLDVEVHRGLTFAEEGVNGVWVLGFDCGHGFDYKPALALRVGRHTAFPAFMREVYRDVAFVRAQVEHLARQLAAMEIDDTIAAMTYAIGEGADHG